MPISDTALVVFVVLSLLIGYLVEPFVVAAVRYSVRQAKRIRLPRPDPNRRPRPSKLTTYPTRRIYWCDGCYQAFRKPSEMHSHQRRCGYSWQGHDFPQDTFDEAVAYYRRMSVPCAAFKPGPHF